MFSVQNYSNNYQAEYDRFSDVMKDQKLGDYVTRFDALFGTIDNPEELCEKAVALQEEIYENKTLEYPKQYNIFSLRKGDPKYNLLEYAFSIRTTNETNSKKLVAKLLQLKDKDGNLRMDLLNWTTGNNYSKQTSGQNQLTRSKYPIYPLTNFNILHLAIWTGDENALKAVLEDANKKQYIWYDSDFKELLEATATASGGGKSVLEMLRANPKMLIVFIMNFLKNRKDSYYYKALDKTFMDLFEAYFKEKNWTIIGENENILNNIFRMKSTELAQKAIVAVKDNDTLKSLLETADNSGKSPIDYIAQKVVIDKDGKVVSFWQDPEEGLNILNKIAERYKFDEQKLDEIKKCALEAKSVQGENGRRVILPLIFFFVSVFPSILGIVFGLTALIEAGLIASGVGIPLAVVLPFVVIAACAFVGYLVGKNLDEKANKVELTKFEEKFDAVKTVELIKEVKPEPEVEKAVDKKLVNQMPDFSKELAPGKPKPQLRRTKSMPVIDLNAQSKENEK